MGTGKPPTANDIGRAVALIHRALELYLTLPHDNLDVKQLVYTIYCLNTGLNLTEEPQWVRTSEAEIIQETLARQGSPSVINGIDYAQESHK